MKLFDQIKFCQGKGIRMIRDCKDYIPNYRVSKNSLPRKWDRETNPNRHDNPKWEKREN